MGRHSIRKEYLFASMVISIDALNEWYKYKEAKTDNRPAYK